MKVNVNKCALILMFSSVEKICFQRINQFYFLLSFACQIALYSAIHHWLLWMKKIGNKKFAAILKESNVNYSKSYFTRSYTISLKDFKTHLSKDFKTHLRICVTANRAVSAALHTPQLGGQAVTGAQNSVPSPLNLPKKASIPQIEIWSTRNVCCFGDNVLITER